MRRTCCVLHHWELIESGHRPGVVLAAVEVVDVQVIEHALVTLLQVGKGQCARCIDAKMGCITIAVVFQENHVRKYHRQLSLRLFIIVDLCYLFLRVESAVPVSIIMSVPPPFSVTYSCLNS